jgi:ABC-type transport system involved in multi-copper enzyme maturation permease subunit
VSVVRAARAEWLRLATPRAALFLPGAAVLGFGYAWALSLAVDKGILGARSGFYLAAAGAGGASLTCAAVGALRAATAVGGALASGVARTALTRGASRAAWIVGRIGALCAGVLLVFLAACLGALLAGLATFGLGAVMEGEYVIAPAGAIAGELLLALALAALAQCAAVALGALIGALLGRGAAAAVAVALFAAALVALSRFPAAEAAMPLASLTTALDRVARLGQGLAGHHATEGALAALAVCLAWLVGALGLSAAVLSRRDVLT